MTCKRCGGPLVDGGVDYYCPDDKCFKTAMVSAFREIKEDREKELYLRLKAKYDPS
jgi:hypothetical protein